MLFVAWLVTALLQAQSDDLLMLPGLTGPEREVFRDGLAVFRKQVSVKGVEGFADTEAGLGPYFNMDSCQGCHSHPTSGGSSPLDNQQREAAVRAGAANRVPAFIKPQSAAIQLRARQALAPWLPAGSVVPLFTITGRSDAPNCDLPQMRIDQMFRHGQVAIRMAPAIYGSGLIEAIPDGTIVANGKKDEAKRRLFGVRGRPHVLSGGRVGRFGWKASHASLEQFIAEAYAVEQGVTNDLYSQEPFPVPPGCLQPTPEDRRNYFARRGIDSHSNVDRLTHFVRHLAAPVPHDSGPRDPELAQASQTFEDIGCGLCHTPTLLTGASAYGNLAEKPVPLYSDLLLDRMGKALADGVNQGLATGDMFRTAPLWGLGKRHFFCMMGAPEAFWRRSKRMAALSQMRGRAFAAFGFYPPPCVTV
ncbi:MAG: hypothetical protein JNK87_13485 [Bryobacterales bacterium]|nr:hypothetical protein [Bryobacterales bacterium]